MLCRIMAKAELVSYFLHVLTQRHLESGGDDIRRLEGRIESCQLILEHRPDGLPKVVEERLADSSCASDCAAVSLRLFLCVAGLVVLLSFCDEKSPLWSWTDVVAFKRCHCQLVITQLYTRREVVQFFETLRIFRSRDAVPGKLSVEQYSPCLSKTAIR